MEIYQGCGSDKMPGEGKGSSKTSQKLLYLPTNFSCCAGILAGKKKIAATVLALIGGLLGWRVRSRRGGFP